MSFRASSSLTESCLYSLAFMVVFFFLIGGSCFSNCFKWAYICSKNFFSSSESPLPSSFGFNSSSRDSSPARFETCFKSGGLFEFCLDIYRVSAAIVSYGFSPKYISLFTFWAEAEAIRAVFLGFCFTSGTPSFIYSDSLLDTVLKCCSISGFEGGGGGLGANSNAWALSGSSFSACRIRFK